MTNFTTNFMSMKTWNVAEAKAGFSSLVDKAEVGATIVICRRNIPVAKLSPYHEADAAPRHHTKIGWADVDDLRLQ